VLSRLVWCSFALLVLIACSGGGGAPTARQTNPFSTTLFVLEGGSPLADVPVSLNQGPNSNGVESPTLQTESTDATGHVTFSDLPETGPICASLIQGVRTYYACHAQPYPQATTISIP
jgi:hypothetical protein